MWYQEILGPIPVLYDELTKPSPEAESTYQNLKKGWHSLFVWGFWEKLYLQSTARPQFDSWASFASRWESGDKDVTTLSAQVSDFHVAEKYAEEYKGPEVFPYPKGGFAPGQYDDPRAPDIEDAKAALKAAEKALKAADEAKGLTKEIPWWVYVAGGTGVVLYTLTILSRFVRS